MVSLCFILICWACHKSAAPRVLFSGLGPTEKAQQNAIILAYHNFKICQDSYMNSFWGVFRIPYFFRTPFAILCWGCCRCGSLGRLATSFEWLATDWSMDGDCLSSRQHDYAVDGPLVSGALARESGGSRFSWNSETDQSISTVC